MRHSKNQTGFTAVEAILVIVILGVIGLASYFVYHAQKSADKTLAQTSQKTETTVTKPVVKNFYDCEDNYLKTHSVETTTCDYAGVHYAIPTTYTNDMIRGYDKIPDAIKPTVVEHAQSIFDCEVPAPTPYRLLSEINVTVVSNKYYDFDESCDSGDHFSYMQLVDGSWVMLGPGQMAPGCADFEKYDIPKDLFGPEPAKQTCVDNVTGQTRLLHYKS